MYKSLNLNNMNRKNFRKSHLIFASSLGVALIVVLVLLSMSCTKSDSSNEILTIEDLLVDNNEITGWSTSGTSWTASSITELTEYINGMAETYDQYGFQEAAQQSYSGTIDDGSRTIQIIIYDLGSEENAQDLYDDPDLGLSSATTWSNGAGTEAHYVQYSGLSEVLTFYSGVYFVYMQVDYDSDGTLSIMKQFALNISGKIE
jgi:hypothetical protein